MQPVAPLAVVIIAPKASPTLQSTLEAVCHAKPKPAQVIVVLEGADAKLRRIAERHRGVRVEVQGQAKGHGAARNIGLDLATTAHVMFLHADESVSPGLFWHLCSSAAETGADLVFAPHVIERASGQLEMRADRPPEDHAHLLRFWLSGRFVPTCAVLWRTDFLRRIGGWEDELGEAESADVVHRAIFNGARLGWARAGYGIYRQADPRTRVYKAVSPQAIAAQFKLLDRLEQLNRQNPLVSNKEIGRAWYKFARRLYARGLADQGKLALARARGLGLREHPGALLGRWLARAWHAARRPASPQLGKAGPALQRGP